jgi:hypothetical protein
LNRCIRWLSWHESVMTRPSATRRIGNWGPTLLLIMATLGARADPPKRVLILDSFGRDVAPFSAVVSSFRTTLARELVNRWIFTNSHWRRAA